MSDEFSEEYGTVIFLDSLGTKGIWKGKDPKTVLKNWKEFIDSIDLDKKIANKQGLKLSRRAFSDTIILTLTGGEKNEIIKESVEMLSSLITYGITKNINLRGAMSIGKFYISDKMILGPAADEASMYYEIANWVGVIATPSLESVLLRMEKNKKAVPLFCKYDIPLHNGKRQGWAIDLLARHSTSEGSLIELIHNKLEDSDDPTGAEKWKNTLEFLYYTESKLNQP